MVHRVAHLLEREDRLFQVVLDESTRDSIGPLNLAGGDPIERCTSSRRQHRELRPLVSRIDAIRQESVGLEQIGGSLNALTGQAHSAADVRDRSRSLVQRSKNLPPRARLPCRPRERLAGAQELAVQSKDVEDQVREGLAGFGAMH
jgi:hypothetical protein